MDLGTKGSYLGAAYTLIPISAGLYFLGSTAGSQKFRETGLLSFEALANTEMTAEVIKVIADRQRPLDDGGNGHFFESNDRLNASFPSGHAINTFALASVFAHEYHNKTWVKVLAYGYAGTVVLSRLIAKQHFAGDTMAGGAMGWFIGDYVYAKRHNPDVDKQTAIQKFLAHVQIGGRLYLIASTRRRLRDARLFWSHSPKAECVCSAGYVSQCAGASRRGLHCWASHRTGCSRT